MTESARVRELEEQVENILDVSEEGAFLQLATLRQLIQIRALDAVFRAGYDPYDGASGTEIAREAMVLAATVDSVSVDDVHRIAGDQVPHRLPYDGSPLI